MIQNPYLPMPSAAAAWAEGFAKGFLAVSSSEPGETVAPEDYQAFNEGVAAGEQAASSGLELDEPCISAAEEPPPGVHEAALVWDAVHFGSSFVEHGPKLVRGTASLVVTFIELACSLPKHVQAPEQVLPEHAGSILNLLTNYGLDHLQLYCGAGLDVRATGCEIRLTPLFKTVDQARAAALEMARYEWVVVSWRTDQSNSFRAIEGG
jgi:hypothetical protein